MASIASLLNPAPRPSECVTIQQERSDLTPLPVQQLPPSSSACSLPAALTTLPPGTISSAFGTTLWTLDLPTHVEQSNATHIQPTKKNGGLSGAQKATQQLQCAANRLLHERFSKELNTLLMRH